MNKQMSDSLKVATLLAFVGGFLEIYSFLLKGHVFATTITGNIILMFFNISRGEFIDSLKYIFPIISFSIGVVFCEKIRYKLINKKDIHWREYVLLIEIILILIISFIKKSSFDILSICLISSISGMQIQAFKKINGSFYMSTMCTGNTRKLLESLCNKDYTHAKVFASIIIFFGLGVVIGGLLVEKIHEISILILLIPLLLTYYIVHYNK